MCWFPVSSPVHYSPWDIIEPPLWWLSNFPTRLSARLFYTDCLCPAGESCTLLHSPYFLTRLLPFVNSLHVLSASLLLPRLSFIFFLSAVSLQGYNLWSVENVPVWASELRNQGYRYVNHYHWFHAHYIYLFIYRRHAGMNGKASGLCVVISVTSALAN